MTYKQIEASREARLWICQIVVPLITIIGTMAAMPQVRKTASNTYNNVKNVIKNKFKKD